MTYPENTDFKNHFEEARNCKEISETFYAHHQRILHVLMNPVVKKFYKKNERLTIQND